MQVKDIMSMSVQTCSPFDSLETVAQRLWEHDIGALPVIGADGRAQAVITDRDVCMAAYTRGKPLAQIQANEAMSSGLISCRSEDEIATAARKMAKHQVRRLPVVDAGGRVVGVLSMNDLALAAGDPPARIDGAMATETLRVLTAASRHRDAVPAVTTKTTTQPRIRVQAAEAAAEI